MLIISTKGRIYNTGSRERFIWSRSAGGSCTITTNLAKNIGLLKQDETIGDAINSVVRGFVLRGNLRIWYLTQLGDKNVL